MDAMAVAHDAAMQMIDTSIVRVHQHEACIAGNREQQIGRSRGGLTSKIHVVVDADYLAIVKLASIRLWLRAYESTPRRGARKVSRPMPSRKYAFSPRSQLTSRAAQDGISVIGTPFRGLYRP